MAKPVLLPANLKNVADMASKDDNRYATSSVRLKFDENKYLAEACDGQRLIRVEGEGDGYDESARIKGMPGVEDCPNGGTEGVVKAKQFKELFGKSKVDELATVIGETVISFGACDESKSEVTSLRQIEDRFPPTDEILPKVCDKPEVVFDVDPVLFAGLLKTISQFTEKGTAKVRVELRKVNDEGVVKTPIVVRAVSSTQKVTGLIMPMG